MTTVKERFLGAVSGIHLRKDLNKGIRRLKPESIKKTIGKAIKQNNNHDHLGFGNHDINNYDVFFERILKGGTIREFVKDRDKPVIIDLMSYPFALRSLFRSMPDHCQLGLSVALSDKRSKKEIYGDFALRIKHVTGDIAHGETWGKINKELEGRKADLIIERGLGGLDNITKKEVVHAALLGKAWKMLSDNGGMLLFETPSSSWFFNSGGSEKMEEWITFLKENNIEAEYDRGTTTAKLIKRPNSPEKLPFLILN